jgi:AhpD family alkylhydroperoxidase
MTELPRTYREFMEKHPEIWQAYEQLGTAAADGGPLDAKLRELVKLGMAAAVGSEGSVASHARRAVEAGASREELEHTLLLGITTIGFARSMAAINWASSALDSK